jgi:AcrR family transcriptional regulator
VTAPASRVGRPRSSAPAVTVPGGLPARAQILHAAAALFAEHGYSGTSTRAIAERVGVRQASLYYHFAGKDEILLELLETSVRPSLVFLDALLAHPDPVAAIHALATIDVGTLLATPHNIGTLYLAHEVQQPRFDRFREQRAELLGAYVELASAVAGAAAGPFLGACCLQLVEMVIELRRDGRADDGTAVGLAEACLRVLGLASYDVGVGVESGSRLREALLGG